MMKVYMANRGRGTQCLGFRDTLSECLAFTEGLSNEYPSEYPDTRHCVLIPYPWGIAVTVKPNKEGGVTC